MGLSRDLWLQRSSVVVATGISEWEHLVTDGVSRPYDWKHTFPVSSLKRSHGRTSSVFPGVFLRVPNVHSWFPQHYTSGSQEAYPLSPTTQGCSQRSLLNKPSWRCCRNGRSAYHPYTSQHSRFPWHSVFLQKSRMIVKSPS